GHRPCVGGEEQRLPGLPAERCQFALREELGDRRANLAALVEDEIRQTLGPPFLRELLELGELAAGERARYSQESHGVRSGEDAELRAARRLRRVLDLERKAKIGLVGAEAPVGLREGHARKRRFELDAETLAPDGRDHRLHQPEQELPVRKRHLEVQLRDLLDAVCAKILVAEADCDLVVALETADYEQLFRDLGRLRQRVEPPWLQARGDEEVAGPFRGRLPQDRGLDVDESSGLHHTATRPDHLAAETAVALELRPPQ